VRITELEAATGSIEDFYQNLLMQAIVAPFDELNLPRIAQLMGKTNQFNLTTRRHGVPTLRAFMQDPNCVHFFLRLCDRFSDHGLVSLMIALRQGDWLDIDTWLMSCRVVGRTVEATMLEYVCRRAQQLGCKALRGTYIPTAQNAIAKDVFSTFGFDLLDESGEATIWVYDLPQKGPIINQFIKAIVPEEVRNERT
jgi:FkbH-like protein